VKQTPEADEQAYETTEIRCRVEHDERDTRRGPHASFPGTLRAAAKQCTNRTPYNRMQTMRINGIRVPNTNKGLQRRACPSASVATNNQEGQTNDIVKDRDIKL
jgi:hypothetical protein